jgi:hypothetical protein
VSTEFIGTGWAYPLGVNANGAVAMVGRSRKLEQAMQLILMTYPGERPMRPEWGSRLRDYVFAGATNETAADVAREVMTALRQWEPRVDIDEVVVTVGDATAGILWIDIRYTPKATNDWRNLVFPFYTIPEGREAGLDDLVAAEPVAEIEGSR